MSSFMVVEGALSLTSKGDYRLLKVYNLLPQKNIIFLMMYCPLHQNETNGCQRRVISGTSETNGRLWRTIPYLRMKLLL